MARELWEEHGAVTRLSDLGLSVPLLHEALMRADGAAATATPFHPTSFEGYMRWAALVSAARESLTSLGWSFDDPQNLPRAVDPSGTFALVVSSGDEFTGVTYAPVGSPSTKNPKGAMIKQAVEVNEQFTLDLGPRFSPPAPMTPSSDLVTWFLMYRYTPNEVFAEVSRPIAMAGAHVSEWAERILLPTVPRDPGFVFPAASDEPDDGDLYNVELSRRA